MHFIDRPFSFPQPLDKALLDFFWAGNNPTSKDLKRFSHRLQQLWPVLAKSRGQQSQGHYSMDRSFAQAYAAYYLPANALKIALVLEEMRLFGIDLSGQRLRWLDVGSGPGTGLWGLAWWAAHRGLEVQYHGLEQSKQFLELSRGLAQKLLANLKLSKVSADWERFDGAPLRGVNSDVVSFMNSIAEIVPDVAARKKWLGDLLDQLASSARASGRPRWLILIEPGTAAASRELLEVRDAIRLRQDVRIWLPCLDARACGALAKSGDWCHEEAECEFPRWVNDLGAEAGMKKESLLFSYLVVSVGVHPEAKWSEGGLRMVSQLLREKGLVQCFLCTTDGKKKARVLNARQTPENECVTRAIRGEIFSHVEMDEKGSVLNAKPFPNMEFDSTVFPKLR